MTAHSLTHDEGQRPLARHGRRNGLLTLGWVHFWLLIGILGGILALIVLVFIAGFSSL